MEYRILLQRFLANDLYVYATGGVLILGWLIYMIKKGSKNKTFITITSLKKKGRIHREVFHTKRKGMFGSK